jgi:hypothetical protein
MLNQCILCIMSKILLRGTDKFATIDDPDAEMLKPYRWYFKKDKSQHIGYAVGHHVKTGKIAYMHRLIMGAEKGMLVDHKNLDSLDNRRVNLRIATHSQSQHNKSAYRNNRSGFKGVTFDKATGKWMGSVNANRANVLKKRFSSKLDAAQACMLVSFLHHGEFSYSGAALQ